jgi:hypothetical protein
VCDAAGSGRLCTRCREDPRAATVRGICCL